MRKCKILLTLKVFQSNTSYMIPRSNHSNGRRMVLISPGRPYHRHHHHHHRYLHLHFFVICSFIFLFNLFIVTMSHDCVVNVLCTLRTLFSVKPFNIIVNRFHTGTTNNYQPATTFRQQKPTAPSPYFHLVASSKLTSSKCFTPKFPFFLIIYQYNP